MCARPWLWEMPANRRPFMPWGMWQLSDVSKKGRREGGTGAVSVLHDSRHVVTRRSWRKERWRWGCWETGDLSHWGYYWGTFFQHSWTHSEAIRHLSSWVSQAGDLWQDILTYPVLKEGVNHSRQTEPNLTATLYVCQGSVGFKEGSKTSSWQNLC